MPRISTISTILAAVAASATLATASDAQTPAAVPAAAQVETRRVEGTDNVYIFRYGGLQSMFVVTSEGVIATDPIGYGRPDAGPLYLAEIRKVTDKPIRYVIYSHGHFDHIAGGKVFKDAGATFVAHRNAKTQLERLRDPSTVVPDEAVGDRRTLTLGGETIELAWLGLNHSDSTLVMRLPKARLIYAVDILPVASLPARGFIDSHPLEWETTIEAVLKMDWDRLIPGHPGPNGRLGTKDDARDILGFLRYASAEVKGPAQAGRCWDRVENEVKLPAYANWEGYAAALPFVLRRYCGLWGRGF
jgi:glyoxylase-like metal-dependent hydrolase (beta-lactamase superfamily II)